MVEKQHDLIDSLVRYEMQFRTIAANARNAAHMWPDLCVQYEKHNLQIAEHLKLARVRIETLEKEVTQLKEWNGGSL